MASSRRLTARQATELLNITVGTLYAYVSRGLIRSEAAEGDPRTRVYLADDVEAMLQRKQQRQNPAKAIKESLAWGAPLMESALTLIREGELYYRGQDVTGLADAHTVEEIAALLWVDDIWQAVPLFATRPDVSPVLEALKRIEQPLTLMQRMQIGLMVASGGDLAAYDLRPASVPKSGARIVHLLTSVLSGETAGRADIAERLAAAWCPEQAAAGGLLNKALILCADHELNVSAFTARVVASADTPPYQVVTAGIAAMQGLRHGGMTERVEHLLTEVSDATLIPQVVGGKIRRGEQLPGFGHPLYPEGDPRGRYLLKQLRTAFAGEPMLATIEAVALYMVETLGELPNVDFAMGALTRLLRLPIGTGMALFALGRSIGWVAHAIEQYGGGQLIRPRATYVGEQPTRRVRRVPPKESERPLR